VSSVSSTVRSVLAEATGCTTTTDPRCACREKVVAYCKRRRLGALVSTSGTDFVGAAGHLAVDETEVVLKATDFRRVNVSRPMESSEIAFNESPLIRFFKNLHLLLKPDDFGFH
jgi:hypothetical protein